MATAAEQIRRIRSRERLSQYELARRSGVAQSTISRIESGDLDPSWSTMSALLDGAGWSADIERTDAAALIPTSVLRREIRNALARGDETSALRDLAEATGRILHNGAGHLPEWATAEPESTGDRKWDTILATALAYATSKAGGVQKPWMLRAKPLDTEIVLGSTDPTPAYRAMIRDQTPPIFREKNILSRERDWAIA